MCDVIITHTDLDGIGCEHIAKELFPGIEVIKADYDNVDAKLKEVLAEGPDLLIISDIWCRENGSKILKDFKGQLLVFDHHISSMADQEKLKKYGHTIIVQEGVSATQLMAETFNYTKPFVALINEYDTTGTLEGEASALNSLFWLSKNWYIHQVLDRVPFHLTEEDYERIRKEKEKKEKEYTDSLSTLEVVDGSLGKTAIVEGNEYSGYICTRLLEDYDCAIMINRKLNKTSLRSKFPVANKIAELCGGGGHPLASGISIPVEREMLIQAVRGIMNEVG